VLNGRLFGVVSWGIGCADAGSSGVYAEVATYKALTTQINS
jgi:trypsin